jgi:hypothetical protein
VLFISIANRPGSGPCMSVGHGTMKMFRVLCCAFSLLRSNPPWAPYCNLLAKMYSHDPLFSIRRTYMQMNMEDDAQVTALKRR